MRTLLKIAALFIPLFVFSQAVLPPELQQARTEVVVMKKEIDSVKTLKAKEVNKQLRIIALIKQELQRLLSSKLIKKPTDNPPPVSYDTARATKEDHDVVYWEEIRRKWPGRLFYNGQPKIRLFKFDSNGKIVYLN